MRGVQHTNNYMKMIADSMAVAQAAQESAKLRQANRARAEVAEQIEKAHQTADELLKKNNAQKINPVKDEENPPSGGYKPARYLKDGSLEKEDEESNESPFTDQPIRHIDFKA
jgi:hypothetical protein